MHDSIKSNLTRYAHVHAPRPWNLWPVAPTPACRISMAGDRCIMLQRTDMQAGDQETYITLAILDLAGFTCAQGLSAGNQLAWFSTLCMSCWLEV